MLEEGTMYTILYQRWVDNESWPVMKAELGKNMDSFLVSQVLLPVFVRNRIKGNCESQGTGLHSRELVYELMEEDIDAVAGLLGDRDYFFGEEMASIDCTIYAFIVNLLTPFPGVHNVPDMVKKHQNLVAYHNRITAALYPEFVDK